MTRALMFMVSCMFANNFVLGRGLGATALLDKDRGIEASAWLGLVVTLIMAASAAVNWLVYNLILLPMNAAFLAAPAFVLVIALAVVGAEALFTGKCPQGASATVLLTANVAMLGASVLNAAGNYGFVDALLNGLFGGLGFLVAIVLMAGVQERIRFSRIPEPMKGFPITLISASLMALAFMGFMGMA